MVQERASVVRPSRPRPSIHSLCGGSMRHIWASPTTSGATTTNASKPDKNHVRQESEYGAAVWA